MTTVGDAIKAALDSNWAGSGGVEPALYNSEDVGQGWPPDNDWIMILGWEYERKRKRRNDTYISETYLIDMRVHSKNDANGEERLDTIVTEIYRIITPTNVTGFHDVDIIYETRRGSDKRTNRFIADLTVRLVVKSTAAAVTPGSGGDGDVVFPANVTVTERLTVLETDDVDLDAVSGSFIVGGDGTGAHVAIDGNEIQAKSDDTTASTLGLNLLGGDIGFGGAGLTLAYIQDLLMFGSANAAWVPCSLIGWNPTAKAYFNTSGALTNVDDTDFTIMWQLSLPPLKGGLKLYVSGTRLELMDADVNNFVTNTYVDGWSDGVKTNLDTDATNKNSTGEHDDTFTAVDCSSYDAVDCRQVATVLNADAFEIKSVLLQCYYAA